jgi:hypothetical protein
MFRIAVVVFLTMSVSCNSFAMELTVDGYREEIGKGGMEKSIILTWLDGVYRGLDWANAVLKAEKRDQWFCPPKKMAVTEEQIQSILDRYIETHDLRGSNAIGLTLLLALEKVFPCH